jgi:membrane-bound lytic murein transglycosylase D
MKFGKLFLVTLFVSVWQPAWADSERKPGLPKKLSKDSVSLKLDSTFTLPERFFSFSEMIPNEPDEVIQDRLSCIKSSIALTLNPFVRSYFVYFTIRNR